MRLRGALSVYLDTQENFQVYFVPGKELVIYLNDLYYSKFEHDILYIGKSSQKIIKYSHWPRMIPSIFPLKFIAMNNMNTLLNGLFVLQYEFDSFLSWNTCWNTLYDFTDTEF